MQRSLGTRINSSYLASPERAVLDWTCARIPKSITPNHLTLFGIAGAGVVFVSYLASWFSPYYLWLASFGLFIHWFGDSLDGSLARYRGLQRPRYGYFLDTMADSFCALLILLGLGLSPFVRVDVALFCLVGYYLLLIYVFLYHHVRGVHQLSFVRLGPTEMRLALVFINLWILAEGRIRLVYLGRHFSPYDCVLALSGVISIAMFVIRMRSGLRNLQELDEGAKYYQDVFTSVSAAGRARI